MVIVGATSMDEERARAMAAGADGFLRMPVCEDELFREIGRVANVEYLWSGEHEGPGLFGPEPVLDGLAVRGMPDEVLQRLRQAIERGYPGDIDEAVERAEHLDPKVGRGLRALARSFDYAALLGLLGPSPEA